MPPLPFIQNNQGQQPTQGAINEAVHNQKQRPVFPYMTNPNQVLPLQNTQNRGQQNPAPGQVTQPQPQQIAQQGQQQLLQAGRQKVLSGFQSPLQGMLEQRGTQLLQDPSQGFSPQQDTQKQLGQFDINQAQQFEKYRRAVAPTTNTGETRQNLQGLALQTGQARSAFQNQLEQQNKQKQQEDLFKAMAEARAVSEQGRQQFQTDVGALTSVLGAGEGSEQRQFQASENAVDRGMEYALNVQNQDLQVTLANLQGKMQQGLQLSANDFAATQNELNRELSKAQQAGDIQAEQNILQMKQQFQGQQEELGRQFVSSQSGLDRLHQLGLQSNDNATQLSVEELRGKIQQGIQLSDQDFKGTENELQRQFEAAIQSEDLGARKDALQAQLDFDRWKQEAGFSLTREENALNRGLEQSLQDDDQVFQEKMLKLKEYSELGIMASQNEWSAVQNDLDRKAQEARSRGDWENAEKIQGMQQEFQGVQNELSRKHEENVQNMIFNQDQWKQGKAEALTKAGWDQQSAMQLADQEHTKYINEYDWKKKELLQKGLNEFQADQQAKQWAYQSKEASFDRQLQKEVESGKLTLEEARLAQQATQFSSQQEFDKWAIGEELTLQEKEMAQQAKQFDSRLDFDRWATQSGLDENEKERVWKASQSNSDKAWKAAQNALDRAHQSNMQNLEISMQEKGMNFQALMQMLPNLPPEQAAALVQQSALESGMTYQSKMSGFDIINSVSHANEAVFVEQAMEKYGIAEVEAINLYNTKDRPEEKLKQTEYNISGKGLQPLGQAGQATQSNQVALQSGLAKLDSGGEMTAEEYKQVQGSGQVSLLSFGDQVLTHETKDARGSKRGPHADRFKDDVWQWLNDNRGNTFKAPDGELYEIVGWWEPGTSVKDIYKTAYVSLKSLKDGSTRKWNTSNWSAEGANRQPIRN